MVPALVTKRTGRSQLVVSLEDPEKAKELIILENDINLLHFAIVVTVIIAVSFIRF